MNERLPPKLDVLLPQAGSCRVRLRSAGQTWPAGKFLQHYIAEEYFLSAAVHPDVPQIIFEMPSSVQDEDRMVMNDRRCRVPSTYLCYLAGPSPEGICQLAFLQRTQTIEPFRNELKD
jgi:hypothetical protein